MKKIIILILMLCVLVYSVSAVDRTFVCAVAVFEDKFHYQTNYNVQPNVAVSDYFDGSNWDNNGVPAPTNSPFDSYAAGYNDTNVGGGNTNIGLTDAFTTNMTGKLLFKFNWSHRSGGESNFRINYDAGGSAIVTLERNQNNVAGINNFSVTGTGLNECFLQNLHSDVEVTIEIDSADESYRVFLNNIYYGCNMSLTDFNYVKGISINFEQAALETAQKYVDDINICIAEIELVSCEEPRVFCDDFNYETTLVSTNDWKVLNQDNGVNGVFSPVNNSIEWTGTNPKTIGYYEIPQFDVDYPTSEGVNITGSVESPVMSIEFDFNMSNATTDELTFSTKDYDFNRCYDFIFTPNGNNIDITFTNETAQEIHSLGSITANVEHPIKIISYFGYEDKDYPFNTSVQFNQVEFYSDGSKVADTKLFNNDCKTLYSAFFTKETNAEVLLDDYYHYVGTDKDTSNVENFYKELFEPQSEATESTADDDLLPVINDFWGDFGLISSGSKILFGLILLFLGGLFIVGGFIASRTEVNFKVVFFLLFIFSLILVFIKLFPAWIIILIALIGSGMTFFVVRSQMAT